MSEVDQIFAMLDGIHKSISTACPECSADVEFANGDSPNVKVMRIMHDDDCPIWAEIRGDREAGNDQG